MGNIFCNPSRAIDRHFDDDSSDEEEDFYDARKHSPSLVPSHHHHHHRRHNNNVLLVTVNQCPPSSNNTYPSDTNSSYQSPHLTPRSSCEMVVNSPITTNSPIIMTPSLKRTDSFTHLKIRELVGKDFQEDYIVLAVIGKGSMGSVSRVRRRKSSAPIAMKRLSSKHKCLGSSNHGSSSHMVPLAEQTLQQRSLFPYRIQKYHQHSSMNNKNMRSVKSSTDLLAYHHQNVLETSHADLDAAIDSIIDDVGLSDMQEKEYAVKSIHLERISPAILEEMRNEIVMLRNFDHPNIVRPIETFERGNQLHVVMELCSGGDLYSRDPYTEMDAAAIISKILSAVNFMHENNVIHRDLKYENILFENESRNAEIKVIDFGLSLRYDAQNPYQRRGVGTIYTMSPEVFVGFYTSKTDMWSIGVIAFMLLSSNMPFYGLTKEQVIRRIRSGSFSFEDRRWMFVSDEAKEFIKALLHLDPDIRPGAKKALMSKWLRSYVKSTSKKPSLNSMDNILGTVENFVKYGKLKKVSLMLLAHNASFWETDGIRSAFYECDPKRKGTISFKQFKNVLSSHYYSEEEIHKIFDAVDVDHRGVIHYTEFLAAALEAHGEIAESKISETFDRFDKDRKGYLSSADLQAIIGEDCTTEDLRQMFAEADYDRDGKISYMDFHRLFRDSKSLEARIENKERISLRRNLSAGNLEGDDEKDLAKYRGNDNVSIDFDFIDFEETTEF